MLNVGLVTHAQLLKSANICNLDLSSPGSQAMLMLGWLTVPRPKSANICNFDLPITGSIWGWLPLLNVGLVTLAQCGAGYPCSIAKICYNLLISTIWTFQVLALRPC